MEKHTTHVAYWDREMHNRAANEGFAEFVGRPRDSIIGRHARELLGDDLYALNLPYAERALAGEELRFHRSPPAPGGGARHLEALFVPDEVNGVVRGFWAIVSEVDQDRVAGAASESVYRRAFFASPVGKAVLDEAGRLLMVNPALATIAGEPAEALVGRALVDLLDPLDRDAENDRLASLFARAETVTTRESRVTRVDGSVLWVLLSLAAAEPAGARGPVGIAQFQDISARREVEEQLRESRRRLVDAERVAGTGSWEIDPRTGEAEWSEGMYAIFGLDPADAPPAWQDGRLRPVHAEDREQLGDAIEHSLAELSALDVEFRIVRPDGRVRTLHAHGEVIVDAEGLPLRLIGITQDVTERTTARESLARAGADMAQTARELQGLAQGLPLGAESESNIRARLTPRQLEIVRMVADGLTNGAIAERLFVSEATVKWHIKQILSKTESSNRAEAVAKVIGAEP